MRKQQTLCSSISFVDLVNSGLSDARKIILLMASSPNDEASLKAMKYRDLQKVAKEVSVRANLPKTQLKVPELKTYILLLSTMEISRF